MVTLAGNEFVVKMLEHRAGYLIENVSTISAKIASAEGADSYDIRIENAAIIRKVVMEILTDTNGLKISGFKEIEEFLILFAEWVNTFNFYNFVINKWGLFNPPVQYNDYGPDNDIPFDTNDFDDGFE